MRDEIEERLFQVRAACEMTSELFNRRAHCEGLCIEQWLLFMKEQCLSLQRVSGKCANLLKEIHNL